MSWSAIVTMSSGERDTIHVVVRTSGDDNHEALKGAAKVAGILTEGRETLVRAVPSATSETDFETKQPIHRGFCRFTLTGRAEVEDAA